MEHATTAYLTRHPRTSPAVALSGLPAWHRFPEKLVGPCLLSEYVTD